MLSSILSRVTTTSVKRNSRAVEISSNSGGMNNNNNNDNGDEPPPDINSGQHIDNHRHRFHNKCESLDEGTFAFMHWMNSENKKSITSDNPYSFAEIC
jgi:hypothetical protein